VRIASIPLLVVVASSAVPGVAAHSAEPALRPPAAYYRPVLVDGTTFPVARAGWLSYLEFRNDWHEPRFRLVDGEWRRVGFHEGIDIISERGTPVVAAAAGTVEAVGWTFYSGTRVGVRGTDGRYYFYAHLSEVTPNVAPGTPVGAGTVLGRVGSTGYGAPGRDDAFPPHLHFGIMDAGGWENPYPMVRSLYRASVEATAEGERRLARLARAGRGEAFGRLVANLYLEE
jgi:murein DD-endopeptidase MepM/ murein hydrolase activator NlpD